MSLTIGQLARSAGVPISTVRYYERAGLLKPDARTPGNYRSYSARSLDRLKFIRSAQSTGFSLDDVREFIGLAGSEDPPCEDVKALTTRRLADVRERIRKLRHVERILARSLKTCCTGEIPDLCDEITRLKDAPARPCRVTERCCRKKVAACP